MDPSKVTVVSGEPRSGTSLMMQTLSLLGVPVVGKSLLDDPEKKKDSIHKNSLNPRGFFEVPGIVMRGLTTDSAPDYYGKVLKIINSGLVQTPCASLGTIILCMRNPKNIVTSQKGLRSNLQLKTDGEWKYISTMKKVSPDLYIRRMGGLLTWIYNNPGLDIFPVEFEDMLSQPDLIIDGIISKLAITVEPIARQASLDNIGLGKPNSKTNDSPVWASPNGVLASTIYQELTTLSITQPTLDAIAAYNQSQSDKYKKTWIMEELGLFLPVNPSLYKSLQDNEDLVKNLVNRSANRAMYDCRKCQYFLRSSVDDNFAIIYGNIQRKKVTCVRDSNTKTIEKCFNCWKTEMNNQKGV